MSNGQNRKENRQNEKFLSENSFISGKIRIFATETRVENV